MTPGRDEPRGRASPVQSPLLVLSLATAAVAVGHGFGRLSYAFVLPAMVDDLVGSYSRAGLLGTANLAAYLAGVVLVISRSGQVSLAAFLRVGLLGVSAGLLLLAVAPSYGLLVVGMVLAGGFNAAIWVPASALVTVAVPARFRGVASGTLGVGVGLAVVVGGGLARGPASGDRGSWRVLWAVTAVVGAVVLVVLSGLLRPLPTSGVRVRLRASVLADLPGAGPLVATYACFAFGYVIYSSYLVAALQDDVGFDAPAAAATYGLTGVTAIGGGVLVGRLSDRLGRRRVLVGSHALMAACAGAVLLGAAPGLAASAALFGVFSSGLPAVVAAYVADHLPAGSVAAAFGVVTLAFGVSQTAAPPVGGLLADASGSFSLTFGLSAAAHVLGAGCAALLPRGRSAPPGASPPVRDPAGAA